MYSDFYDEKDGSEASLGQRSISLVSEVLAVQPCRHSVTKVLMCHTNRDKEISIQTVINAFSLSCCES